MDAAEVLLILNIFSFAIYAPFTKVEESFNIQACHDVLEHGVYLHNLPLWDHNTFPGAVPRTFVGPLILSGLAWIPIQLGNLFMAPISAMGKQMAVRIVLGLVNAIAMIQLKRSISRVHGKTAALLYLALQGTQFHVMYYASRTLPNFFAFPLTTVATAALVEKRSYLAITLLTAAAVIFRAEIVLLLGPLVLHHLYCGNITMGKTIRRGLVAGTLSLVISAVIDSYLWGYWVMPELSGVLFNVVHGKSSDWGVSPWYQYALDVVKLLLNPISLPLVGIATYYHRETVLPLLVPSVVFCTIYSFQPHKEWRFIVYIIPGLTFIAALGASHLYNRQSKNVFYRVLTIGVLASIPCTALLSHTMGMISMMSYPGGEMMSRIPTTNQPVYLDVLTCMTGATKFLQIDGTYERPEDDATLRSIDFWNGLKYASVSDPDVVVSSDTRWRLIDKVYGYSGVDLKQLRIKKEIKLYLLENTRHD